MFMQPRLATDPAQFGGIVTTITANATFLWISIDAGNLMNDFALQYNHPGYSSIFTLLMASAVNKKEIYLAYAAPAAGETMGAIQEAQMQF